jgi:flagellin
MVMSVNTNVLSLNAQRSMMATQNELSTSIERLSTGFRINSAKDDAAGLAIAERFTSSIRGASVAQRNANDGISFAQTVEGALDVIGNNLQRIRELAVQSLNDSNTEADRDALDQEVQQLTEEIDRIAKNTTFNGRNILDGSLGTLNFQIGAERGQTLAISGFDARAEKLGQTFGVVRTNGGEPITTHPNFQAWFTDYLANGGEDDFTVNGVAVSVAGVNSTDAMVNAVNAVMSETGVQASRVPGFGHMTYADSSGNLPTFGGTEALLHALALDPAYYLTDTEFRGVDTLSVANTSPGGASARDSANSALAVLDTAIDQITSMRAELGALQNRFENVIEVAGVQNENLSAARSRIQDADFAAETANLTRAQILQQAGLASLAQANASPQAVLALLG